MKAIFRIARAELEILFYSPIAWFMLILFTIQAATTYFTNLEFNLRNILNGNSLDFTTYQLYAGDRGFFTQIIGYIYLFFPLLTMGLISKEYSSGSIKLLYSSPVSNTQIILGKYLATLVYSFTILIILALFALIGILKIENPDVPLLMTGLFGIFLLMTSYCAIGLFFSSLTNYQIIAALATFGVLMALQQIQYSFQDIEIMREITFWLSLDGRVNEFINGLICSEDVLYFLIISTLFLSLTVLRLQAKRQKLKFAYTWGKYTTVVVVAIFLGYLSSRPFLMTFRDVTATKMRTLTPASQEVIKKLHGGLTFTTYSNMFDNYFMFMNPRSIVTDIKRYNGYWRFKPEIKFKYVFYYDDHGVNNLKHNHPELTLQERMLMSAEINKVNPRILKSFDEIQDKYDFDSEQYRIFKLIETGDGKKTVLRFFDDGGFHPKEKEITAALKHLVMDLPKVGFVQSNGTRSIKRDGERDYSFFTTKINFSSSLVNNGFDLTELSLKNEIPDDIDILVLPDLRTELSIEENTHLNNYINRGGNLLILGEPGKQDILNPILEQFNLQFFPGTIVTNRNVNQQPDFLFLESTAEAAQFSFHLSKFYRSPYVIVFTDAMGIERTGRSDFKVTSLLRTPSTGYWNELQTTNYIDEVLQYNPRLGEVEQEFDIVLALSRMVNNKEQKIIISGDADCLSLRSFRIGTDDSGKKRADNPTFCDGLFHWLSDHEAPIDVRRPSAPDTTINMDMPTATRWKKIFTYGISGVFLITFLLIWIRRRGR